MLQSRIRRGQRDREITFITPEYGDSDSNEDKVESWVEVETDPTVYAAKEDVPGAEEVIGDRPTVIQRTKFITDYREDITNNERVVCDEKVYEIISVTEFQTGRERDIEIICNRTSDLWT